ncbi:hypothetical protein CRG98_038006 [Punica granatum]|uniref:ABC transmembrane type-1 domain-containing protein n=1 Tax=Punica granatum TaxID=22663 RepID=A0A2I0IE03_PUNGR|nr:hypothetical protein CRG98_038006 [Punica granatum]
MRRLELTCACFLSRLFFSWVNPLLKLGSLKPIRFRNIPCVVSEDEANIAYQNFARAWDSLMKEKSSHSDTYKCNMVIKAITKVQLKENILIGFYAFLCTISVVVSPLILYVFVRYSSRDKEENSLSQDFNIGGCLVVTKLVKSLSQRHWFFGSRRSGMRMRSALAAVYKKQLKLSSSGRRRHSTGEIVNYIGVDAYKMGEFLLWLHSIRSLSLQLVLSIGVLIPVIGTGALPGLVPLIICAQEGLRTALYWMSPTVIFSVVFLGCLLLGSAPLQAGTIFMVLATLQVIVDPVRTIPEALSALIQFKVSLDQINAFLLDEEIEGDRIKMSFTSPSCDRMVSVNGSIAYVSQDSWIQILFGKPMDEERFEKAIKSCALDKDINSFDHGDLAEIGQGGINMSGGQKPRIQLA